MGGPTAASPSQQSHCCVSGQYGTDVAAATAPDCRTLPLRRWCYGGVSCNERSWLPGKLHGSYRARCCWRSSLGRLELQPFAINHTVLIVMWAFLPILMRR